MNIQCDGNNVVLIGKKVSDFVFGHETAGEYFYTFTLESSRYRALPTESRLSCRIVLSARKISTMVPCAL